MKKTIYTEFADFVEENGEFIISLRGLKGEKMIYEYKGYLIQLDLEPITSDGRIVVVLDRDTWEITYASRFLLKGYQLVTGERIDSALSSPKILKNLLRRWKSEKALNKNSR